MIDEETIKKYIKLTPQSRGLIAKLKDFDLDDFMEWFVTNKLIVGGAHLLEYLGKKGELNDNKNE